MKITILDPAMCCSTGVCGEDVDDALVQTAANVKWLKSLGYEVNRHNISNDGAAFKNYPAAIEKLQKEGMDSLPYILINDEIVMEGSYPTKEEWMQFLANETSEKESPKTKVDDATKTSILISIGAAIAASNEKALKQFINEAKGAKISLEEIANAMNIGNDCRVKLSHEVIQTANTLLNEMQPAATSCCSGTGCC
ncbi:MAG: arsenite efflux transporter metallochaperone ArsD [Flavobacteriaceae bacterium]